MRYKKLIILTLFSCLINALNAEVWHVKSGSELSEITKVLDLASDNDTIYIHKGTYYENLIVIDKQLVIIGIDNPVIDSRGGHEIMVVTSNNVTISGLTLQNVGKSFRKDRAAIRLKRVSNVVIENNRLYNTFFGIYLQDAKYCKISANIIVGNKEMEQVNAGNAIHIWKGKNIDVIDNEVSHHRDGIYFEFVNESYISGNISRNNMRYGLHFMFSNNDVYEDNIFDHNGSGVAVMFSQNIEMLNNHFMNNWGGASYGILLKEISNGLMKSNTFERNTVGVLAEGATNIKIIHNDFINNGKALNIKGNCLDNKIVENNFIANTFEVLTNTKSNLNHYEKNYWSGYAGYDLNRDGIGDEPYRPVSLYAKIIGEIPAASLLLHSLVVNLIDFTERIIPQLIPSELMDKHPKMQPYNYD